MILIRLVVLNQYQLIVLIKLKDNKINVNYQVQVNMNKFYNKIKLVELFLNKIENR